VITDILLLLQKHCLRILNSAGTVCTYMHRCMNTLLHILWSPGVLEQCAPKRDVSLQ